MYYHFHSFSQLMLLEDSLHKIRDAKKLCIVRCEDICMHFDQYVPSIIQLESCNNRYTFSISHDPLVVTVDL